jgi:hypothetical protein
MTLGMNELTLSLLAYVATPLLRPFLGFLVYSIPWFTARKQVEQLLYQTNN